VLRVLVFKKLEDI